MLLMQRRAAVAEIVVAHLALDFQDGMTPCSNQQGIAGI